MKFVAAAVQMVASDDKAVNFKEAEHWIGLAAKQGARLVALPEVFIWRGNKDRKSTRLNSSHIQKSRMPSSA